jgi:hypothetical protein
VPESESRLQPTAAFSANSMANAQAVLLALFCAFNDLSWRRCSELPGPLASGLAGWQGTMWHHAEVKNLNPPS